MIVDDELAACNNLKNILTNYVDLPVDIVSIAHDTYEAEAAMQVSQPDAVFLDIEMPNEDAFQFLERIYPVKHEIVFVTAYDEYAVKAFKLNAVDYILKPLSIDEVTNATLKLQERMTYRKMIADKPVSYTNLYKQMAGKSVINKITLKDNNIIDVVDFKNVFFVEAKGSYSRVVYLKGHDEKEVLMSHSIAAYEEMLPEGMFFRIHKSYLVNCSLVEKVLKEDNPFVVMENKCQLPVSRRRFQGLIDYLKNQRFF